MRFLIITPTIGRDTLPRCLNMVKHSVYSDYLQVIIGDGPQPSWVKYEASKYGCTYIETPSREGYYGTAPRNYALMALEMKQLGNFDYVIHVDDDNLLLEPALYNANKIAEANKMPPLMWQEIIFTNKYTTDYQIQPKCGKPIQERDWDSLSAFYRVDVIQGLRWKPAYNHDWIFATEASNRVGGRWMKIPSIGGVHCVSWDSYELTKCDKCGGGYNAEKPHTCPG